MSNSKTTTNKVIKHNRKGEDALFFFGPSGGYEIITPDGLRIGTIRRVDYLAGAWEARIHWPVDASRCGSFSECRTWAKGYNPATCELTSGEREQLGRFDQGRAYLCTRDD
mgnify:FL=1|jgi:hypothetical protein|tara:strand:+ start:3442 stop:3774 length:333 start_codon:yes stop_codon:yes gene_type:complete